MFKKVSRMAEQTATGISRRGFFGRFGRGAVTAAAAMGAILAIPTAVHAGKYEVKCCPKGYYCPKPRKGCRGPRCDGYGCVWACDGWLVFSQCVSRK